MSIIVIGIAWVLSPVQLFVTPWTAASQDPLCMEFFHHLPPKAVVLAINASWSILVLERTESWGHTGMTVNQALKACCPLPGF